MMQQKFTSISDHPLYLLLVNSVLILIIFFSFHTHAEIFEGKGMSYWDDRTSKKEACDNALNEAKNDALRQLGLESIKSDQIETCLDSGDQVRCQLYQTTFNNISGGYIKDFEVINKGRGGNDQKFCVVEILADAYKFKGKHDPEFIVDATVGTYVKLKKNDKYNNQYIFKYKKNIFFEGDNLAIKGNLTKKAFINILAWYPNIYPNSYFKLFPNKYEKNTLMNNVFFVPNKDTASIYQLDLRLPENFKANESQEYIIVLATKKKFAILNKTNISNLLSRLDELGKNNWYMKKLGYSIIREK